MIKVPPEIPEEKTENTKSLSNLDKLLASKSRSFDGDTLSSDEEYYGDESDLLSVASIVHSSRSLIPSVPDALDQIYWSEPCASSYRIRGKKYMTDRKKVNSAPSLFRLIATDLCKVDKPIKTGFCAHPSERVQKYLLIEKKGEGTMPPFIFCVNIIVPGSPHYHMVFYYAVDDISLISPPLEGDEATAPFTKIASKFFFGSSDKFRDSVFKLIPRIVSGNVLVRKAVGSKPTILGKKLKQIYIRNERFLEVIVDIGSSIIASKVVKLSQGYAKNIVVDMAFVLEGRTESTLPEQAMGTVRLSNVDFNSNLRLVAQP